MLKGGRQIVVEMLGWSPCSSVECSNGTSSFRDYRCPWRL
jgi:hypothetical protein